MAKEVSLRFVGTGDAFGSGGRLNSCYHLTAAGRKYLIECGCSCLAGLRRYQLDPGELDTVLISHLHGDHFGGIPFLLLEAKYISQRQRPLTLIGPKGLQRQVEAALEALYPGAIGKGVDFPLIYRELDPATTMTEGDLTIRCWPVRHGNSQEVYALQVEVAGRTIGYTGDTEWTENLLELASGCNLLIAECFAFDGPSPSHLNYQALLQHRKDLDCQRLVLTHLGDKMLERLAEVEMEVVSDGDLIEL